MNTIYDQFIEDRKKLVYLDKINIPNKLKYFLIKIYIKKSLKKIDIIINQHKLSRNKIKDIYNFFVDFHEFYKLAYSDATRSGFNKDKYGFQMALYTNCISLLFDNIQINMTYKVDIYKFGYMECDIDKLATYMISAVDDNNLYVGNIESIIYYYMKDFIEKYLESYKFEWECVKCIEK